MVRRILLLARMLHVDIAVTLQIAAYYDTLPLTSRLARNIGGKRYSYSTATKDGIRSTSPSVLIVEFLTLILQPVLPENSCCSNRYHSSLNICNMCFFRGPAQDFQRMSRQQSQSYVAHHCLLYHWIVTVKIWYIGIFLVRPTRVSRSLAAILLSSLQLYKKVLTLR